MCTERPPNGAAAALSAEKWPGALGGLARAPGAAPPALKAAGRQRARGRSEGALKCVEPLLLSTLPFLSGENKGVGARGSGL